MHLATIALFHLSTPMNVTTPTATLKGSIVDRWNRFMAEDAVSVLLTSTTAMVAVVGKEIQQCTTNRRNVGWVVLKAIKKSTPLIPFALVSSIGGVVGLKMTLSAVQSARHDYTRESVKIALPLFVGVLYAPRGFPMMTKVVLGSGLFIHAVDYGSTHWHKRNEMELKPRNHFEPEVHDIVCIDTHTHTI